MLDVDEIDQGQRDQPRSGSASRPAACSFGPSVWEPEGLRPGRADVPGRRRVRVARAPHGYRVVTTPSAQITHRQVGHAGLRPRGASGPRPGKVDRLLGMWWSPVMRRRPGLPLVWLRLVWSCLLHAMGYLLGKVPGRALDEMAALGLLRGPSRSAARAAQADGAPSSRRQGTRGRRVAATALVVEPDGWPRRP